MRWLLALTTTLLVANAALAGIPVTVDAKLPGATAAPGDTVEAVFHVEVPEGWHLYPPGTKDGVPIEVKLDPVSGIAAGALVPRSGLKELQIEGLGKFMALVGAFDVAWKLQVAKDAAPGQRKLTGKFAYQACNDQTCEQPAEIGFELSLDIQPKVDVGPPIEVPAAKGPAIAHLSLAADAVHAGDAGVVVLDIFIAPDHHIYAPGSEPDDRVTKLELELPPGFTQGPLDVPAPTHAKTDELGKANEWEGRIKLTRSFTVPANVPPGKVVLKAHATWLCCDEKGCVQGSEDASLPLEVQPALAGKTPVAPPTDAAPAGGSGAGALILTAISLGLINVLMPCTLPMIPITISIFSKGKKLSRGQSLFRASVYAAGIIISFTVMGGVIQAVFGSAGQGIVRTIAANGPLNLGIAALFVYFALSFFGYYEIELPEFLRAFVEKSVDKAKSGAPGEGGIPLPALFLMGFFFVLTSYTCGAPLVLGVLTAGLATPGKASVLLGTATFGATTAAPFFVLALVPGLLKSLPKSGGWFKTFKVVLGTIELAAALKFFSNADIYWHAGILTRNVFIAVWVGAGIFMTLYVAHVIKLAHDEEATEPAPKFQPKAWLRAVPFILATCYVADALNGAKLPPEGTGLARLRYEIAVNFEGFLPPDPYPGAETKVADGKSEAGRLPAYSNYDKALAAAQKGKRPLFLEFTGHV
jgi:thiol:disulfide interchange protein DsbD